MHQFGKVIRHLCNMSESKLMRVGGTVFYKFPVFILLRQSRHVTFSSRIFRFDDVPKTNWTLEMLTEKSAD